MGNIIKKRVISTAGSGSSSGGSSTPTSISYAALSATITANTTTEGFYLITDSTSGADAGVLVQVFNDIDGVNKVRMEAEGVFYNPDYQSVGDYSGIAGFGTQLGVWHSGLTPAADDVVIWNGIHYRNITGAVGTTPSGDAVNWDDRPKSSNPLTNGYIAESDFIHYDFSIDSILYRADKRGNNIFINYSTFQFGNDLVSYNTQKGYSQISNLNQRGQYLSVTTDSYAILTSDNTHIGAIQGSYFAGQDTVITLNDTLGVAFESYEINQNPASRVFNYNNFS